jgi:4-hydroxybenzoate polyprenyltransferase
MNLKTFIKLIRFDNLLVIALTMFAVRYGMIKSILFIHNPPIPLQLSLLDFSVLTLSTVLIAASGYIINDYFDVKTDKINKPEKLYIDHGVKRRVAIFIHMQFNLVGFVMGAYVAYKAGNIYLSLLPFLSITALWFYSTHFKRQLIIGNVVVSALSMLIPLQVLLFEKPLIENIENLTFLYTTVICFASFAFLLTMAREIIKDLEDVKGDAETGCKTMPVVWGMKAAKAITAGIISNTLLLLVFICYKLVQKDFSVLAAYLFLFVFLPCIIFMWKLYRSNEKKDFHFLSMLAKFIMITGVLSTVVVYFLCHGFTVGI